MSSILNQFRRIYADNGSGDVDFTEQETRLREARLKLLNATNELMRASERLNRAALSVDFPAGEPH